MLRPADEDIQELTRTAFSCLLGIDLASGGPSVLASAMTVPARAEQLVFTIDIHGAWSGSVHIEVDDALARRLASAMFDNSDVSQEEIIDAMNELANVIGGNIKGLVPGPSRLSLPRASLLTNAKADRHWFTCEGHPFSVSVTNRPSDPDSDEEMKSPS